MFLILLFSLIIATSSWCPTVRLPASSTEHCASSTTSERSYSGNISEAIKYYLKCLNDTCNCTNDPTWTQVGYLDMTDSSQSCPSAWAAIINSTVRGCGRQPSIIRSCDSVFYSTRGMRYSKVCGRINAYQFGSPHAFQSSAYLNSIDSNYIDGVSLTHGLPGSRTHVWSFVNAWTERASAGAVCPCMFADPSTWPNSIPTFIENNYFCAAGTTRAFGGGLYPDNPLWDGVGCAGHNTCCQFNQPPWFCRTLPTSTTDNLEIRICHRTNSANTYISNIELYVK